MQKKILAFIVIVVSITVGHVLQLAAGAGANFGQSLGFGVACAVIPVIAIYKNFLAAGFLGGLLLSALLLLQAIAPHIGGGLTLLLVIYFLAYSVSRRFRGKMQTLFTGMGLGGNHD